MKLSVIFSCKSKLIKTGFTYFLMNSTNSIYVIKLNLVDNLFNERTVCGILGSSRALHSAQV